MIRAYSIALFLCAANWAYALDPPEELTIRAFLKPAGAHLHLLLRVPLKGLNGIEFPARNPKGDLDLPGVEAVLPSAARWWFADNIELYEGDRLLPKPAVAAAHLSLPSDDSFGSYGTALAHVTGSGLPPDTQVFRDQALVDVLIDYPIQSDTDSFAIHSNLSRLATRVSTDLVVLSPNGAVRTFEYAGDPGLFRLNPGWRQTVVRFAALGFWRVSAGADALLLLFCVALLFREYRALLPFAAAFTIAHAVTLIASAFHLASDALWFPVLIGTLVAASILYMAFASIAAVWQKQTGGTNRWIPAVAFGLIYGFAFAFTLLPALQFAGSHTLLSVLSFNFGIEIGQVLVLVLLVPAIDLLLRFTRRTQLEITILAALVADLAWHRFTDRAEQLSQFTFRWPVFDAQLLAAAMAWLTIFLVLGGVAFLVLAIRRHRYGRKTAAEPVSGRV